MTETDLALPKLGLGTYQMHGAACQAAVESALALGYRHIDTGQMYGNEAAVGAGIAASGLPRAEIFLTGKVCHALATPDEARVSLNASLERLQTDYLDLCLLHWPRAGLDIPGILEMLMRVQEAGKTRRIGVANFTLPLLQLAVTKVGAPLLCNQVEYHVLLDQTPLLSWLRAHDMMLVAHVPLARGRLVDHPALAAIAARHGATAAQVALKWLLDQDGVAAIPKAGRAASQRENLAALDLTLDEADLAMIAGLPKDVRVVDPPFAPEWHAVG
ncbi:MAG: aldo/keto reductase [Acetobacteraceae bacterium]|jgi:2,5-diketo-D-gluconate reductase B